MARQWIAWASVSVSAAALVAVAVLAIVAVSDGASSSADRDGSVRISANPPRVSLRFTYALDAYAPAVLTSALTLATVLLRSKRLGADIAESKPPAELESFLVYFLSVAQSFSLALYSCAKIPVQLLVALVYTSVVRHGHIPREEPMRAPVAWILAVAHVSILAALFAREPRRGSQSHLQSAAFICALALTCVRDASNVSPYTARLAYFDRLGARIVLSVATQVCIVLCAT